MLLPSHHNHLTSLLLVGSIFTSSLFGTVSYSTFRWWDGGFDYSDKVRLSCRREPLNLHHGRLSEVSSVTVGVIEAGQFFPDEPLVNTPCM